MTVLSEGQIVEVTAERPPEPSADEDNETGQSAELDDSEQLPTEQQAEADNDVDSPTEAESNAEAPQQQAEELLAE